VIVIGIAPGLKSIAYSVLDVSGPLARTIDADVLLGGRIQSPPSGDPMGALAYVANLARKANVHRLVLSVVFERDPPLVVGLGPPCNPKEPRDRVEAVELVVRALAATASIPVRRVSEPDIPQTLMIGARESLFRLVNRHLEHPIEVEDRRLVLATGIALTAASLWRS
jgi:hypothetical protein